MEIVENYMERVYAGVLGKIIGVYLGRPFEGWSHERITNELGEVWQYMHKICNVPLVVTDDDISGTFTFLRALEDAGYTKDLTSAQIGQAWQNYLIEGKTILWWGGLGRSTEHTAYLRLKHGIPAPKSGSMELNGKIVAEQIGAQIFIDGWAMVTPGDPELAVNLAQRAASVSHDGEAIYGAQMLAAMESLAFIEPKRDRLLDAGLSFIPADSLIARMIHDIRAWHAANQDWRMTFDRIRERYGYDRYTGGCHIVPNHALIILGFLYGDDDFQKSLMIVNTCGWDTDCNSGNLGCLLGIKNGLAGLAPSAAHPEKAFDLRTPVADRLYITSTDGSRVISDAVIETMHIVNAGRGLRGLPPRYPKDGARFHFEAPGSVQGFQGENVSVENVAGHSQYGTRSLRISAGSLEVEQLGRATTPTFTPPEGLNMPGYILMSCPTVYPGQVVRARLEADSANTEPMKIGLGLTYYNANDQLQRLAGPYSCLVPGESGILLWRVPPDVHPVAEVAVELYCPGEVYLDWLRWDGTPNITFTQPSDSSLPWPGPKMWRKAWIESVDHWDPGAKESFRIIQDEGIGWLLQGGREWKNYHVSAKITPILVQACGLATRVQGMRRYYALLLVEGGIARLVKMLDGEEFILAEKVINWQPYQAYDLALDLKGNWLRCYIGGKQLFDLRDNHNPLLDGGIALVVEDAHMYADEVSVRPVD